MGVIMEVRSDGSGGEPSPLGAKLFDEMYRRPLTDFEQVLRQNVSDEAADAVAARAQTDIETPLHVSFERIQTQGDQTPDAMRATREAITALQTEIAGDLSQLLGVAAEAVISGEARSVDLFRDGAPIVHPDAVRRLYALLGYYRHDVYHLPKHLHGLPGQAHRVGRTETGEVTELNTFVQDGSGFTLRETWPRASAMQRAGMVTLHELTIIPPVVETPAA